GGKRDVRDVSVNVDSGRDLQRDGNGECIWQPVAVQRSRNFQHGQIDGAGARLHNGGGGAVPTCVDGTAAYKTGLGRASRDTASRHNPSAVPHPSADIG